jgi:hypothetical protein
MRGSLVCAIAFVSIASTALISAQQPPEIQAGQQQTAENAARARPPAPITLSDDGKLSVNVSRASLATVMKQISILADVPIVVSDTLGNDVITFKGRDLPVDEGLKQLLAAYDVFFLYTAPDHKTPGAIKSVWVYGRGDGWDLQPVPSAMWASTKELERRLEDPDPNIRSETYEQLIERGGEGALPTALKGLTDPDENVRARTLSSAIDEDIEIPVQDLQAIILDAQGQSQSLRVLALQSIQTRPEAEAIATSVMNDQDEMVRNEARRILGSRRPPG